MKKYLTLTIFFAFIGCALLAQSNAAKITIDSLKRQLLISKNDKSSVLIYKHLCNACTAYDFDSVAMYGKRGIALAQKIGFSKGELGVMYAWQSTLEQHGDIPQSMELNFKALEIAREKQYTYEIALGLSNIGSDYWDLQDYPKAINFYKEALITNKLTAKTGEVNDLRVNTELSLGDSYSKMNRLDSAFFFIQKTYMETLNDDWHRTVLLYLGDVLFKMGNRKTAFEYLRQSIILNERRNDDYTSADAYKTIARFFKVTNQSDSTIFYAKKGLAHAQAFGFKMDILITSNLLADEYENRDSKQAFYYLKLRTTINEQLFGKTKVMQLQKILSEEQQREREIELKRINRQNQLKQYLYLAGLAIVILIASILYWYNEQRKRANKILESTLSHLKSTQTQLIQSEKMASLGELTAGIAHEIQNPLNFVNNFSEVNKEMLEELKAESEKPKAARDEQLEIELLNSLIENEQKISHHGKRADAIVKGMLEHSRVGTGEKQLTDINVLADEFLKLSYHGLRAKNKNFNAELITNFDTQLPKINTMQQDMGRVLLNLFNNAFYAVEQKAKTAGEDYKPGISVGTSIQNEQAIITVKDNGIGIPDGVKEKIMQPFFTTKPTGEGTGLGLSLTYDIVVKRHGGNIQVNSVEGEGAEFIITLPLK